MFSFAAILLFLIHGINAAKREEITKNQDISLPDIITVSSKFLDGGAYFIHSPATSVNVTGCVFLNCNNSPSCKGVSETNINGGAICIVNLSDTCIRHTTFTNCSSSCHGGAIAFSNVNEATILNSTFTLCNASCNAFGVTTFYNGGAISFNNTKGCSLIIHDSTFAQCHAQKGGAIFCNPELECLIAINCDFCNNTAYDYEGGAICAGDITYLTPVQTIIIESTKFRGNSLGGGSKKGSAIFLRTNNVTIKNCYVYGQKGLIKNESPVFFISIFGQYNFNIDSCIFESNTGGSITVLGTRIEEVTVTNCSFINNAHRDSSLIQGDPYLPDKCFITDCVFKGNSNSYETGHDLRLPQRSRLVTIIKNTVFDGTGVTANGPALYTESKIELTNVTFSNHAKYALSLSVISTSAKIYSIAFIGNSCSTGGEDGFIGTNSNITFWETSLDRIIIKSANQVHLHKCNISKTGIDLTANLISIHGLRLEAIVAKGFVLLNGHQIDIIDSTISDVAKNYIAIKGTDDTSEITINNSSLYASAVSVVTKGSLLISRVNFQEIFSNAALHAECGTVSIAEAKFANCRPGTGNGGAIYAKLTQKFNLYKCTFDSCTSPSHGSALYLEGGAVSVISNCTFHNIASNLASIYLNDASLASSTVLTECCFTSATSANDEKTVNANIAHIYSEAKGVVSFEAPMCFDKTKEESVYFKQGQDADHGYDCYKCTDCGKMPIPSVTVPPTAVPPTASVPPTPSQTEKPDDDDDSGSSKKLSTPAIVGIAIGAIVGLVLIIVAVVFIDRYIHKRNDESLLNPEPLSSAQPGPVNLQSTNVGDQGN